MSTNVGMAFPEWVRDNYFRYVDELAWEGWAGLGGLGGNEPPFAKSDVDLLQVELPEYGIHLTRTDIFGMWIHWVRFVDINRVSTDTLNVKQFVRHYRREWNIYTDKVRKGKQ